MATLRRLHEKSPPISYVADSWDIAVRQGLLRVDLADLTRLSCTCRRLHATPWPRDGEANLRRCFGMECIKLSGAAAITLVERLWRPLSVKAAWRLAWPGRAFEAALIASAEEGAYRALAIIYRSLFGLSSSCEDNAATLARARCVDPLVRLARGGCELLRSAALQAMHPALILRSDKALYRSSGVTKMLSDMISEEAGACRDYALNLAMHLAGTDRVMDSAMIEDGMVPHLVALLRSSGLDDNGEAMAVLGALATTHPSILIGSGVVQSMVELAGSSHLGPEALEWFVHVADERPSSAAALVQAGALHALVQATPPIIDCSFRARFLIDAVEVITTKAACGCEALEAGILKWLLFFFNAGGHFEEVDLESLITILANVITDDTSLPMLMDSGVLQCLVRLATGHQDSLRVVEFIERVTRRSAGIRAHLRSLGYYSLAQLRATPD